ncbi:MAG: hypothetical protein AUH30_13440 [Candidatus Rokubacteria bacterium 13_1_40CM_68_15]|nr:MAG: hypothetical protein AUH30_13440 [Candidatus Rokubacteria bacterium 13_1_40CM_68_15]
MKLVSAVVVVLALVAPALAQQSPSGTYQTPGQAPSTSPAPSGSAPSSGSQPAVQIDSSSIIGSPVRSADGKELGKISRLMIDPREGRITTAVISMGSKLGVGGRTVAVPWTSLKAGQDQRKLVFTVDQQLLDQAPSASPAGEDKQSRPSK